MTDAGFCRLADLPRLTTLQLRFTKVTDVGVAHLAAFPRLRWLSVADTGVAAEALDVMSRLQALQYLEIDTSQAGKSALPALRKLHLKRLRLRQNVDFDMMAPSESERVRAECAGALNCTVELEK